MLRKSNFLRNHAVRRKRLPFGYISSPSNDLKEIKNLITKTKDLFLIFENDAVLMTEKGIEIKKKILDFRNTYEIPPHISYKLGEITYAMPNESDVLPRIDKINENFLEALAKTDTKTASSSDFISDLRQSLNEYKQLLEKTSKSFPNVSDMLKIAKSRMDEILKNPTDMSLDDIALISSDVESFFEKIKKIQVSFKILNPKYLKINLKSALTELEQISIFFSTNPPSLLSMTPKSSLKIFERKSYLTKNIFKNHIYETSRILHKWTESGRSADYTAFTENNTQNQIARIEQLRKTLYRQPNKTKELEDFLKLLDELMQSYKNLFKNAQDRDILLSKARGYLDTVTDKILR
jgi:hypothetical protein